MSEATRAGLASPWSEKSGKVLRPVASIDYVKFSPYEPTHQHLLVQYGSASKSVRIIRENSALIARHNLLVIQVDSDAAALYLNGSTEGKNINMSSGEYNNPGESGR